MRVKQLFSEHQVLEVVVGLAQRISRDYKDKNPLLIGCLTGSFVFMADLVRRLFIPVECDFMKVSSYEDRMSAGEIRLLLDATLPVKGRNVLIIEDIVDTGQSLKFIADRLSSKGPASLESCVLLYKESPRITVKKDSIKYLGLTVPDVFIVGYGIDCAQKFRELPYVGYIEDKWSCAVVILSAAKNPVGSVGLFASLRVTKGQLKINEIHKWDVSPKEAISIQRELLSRLDVKRKIKGIKTIAGADMAIDGKTGYAGIIIYTFPELVEVERQYVVSKIEFPYVPGLLAFREAPILLAAFEKVKIVPDVVMIDGQGIAHPRGMGIASHMGLFLGRPTIGCAKSRLVGEYREPGNDVGDWSPLIVPSLCKGGVGRVDLSTPSVSPLPFDLAQGRQRGRCIGAVLRTRKNVKPVFISPGHLIDLPSSIEIVLACLDRTRIPKPTREADHFVGQLRRPN